LENISIPSGGYPTTTTIASCESLCPETVPPPRSWSRKTNRECYCIVSIGGRSNIVATVPPRKTPKFASVFRTRSTAVYRFFCTNVQFGFVFVSRLSGWISLLRVIGTNDTIARLIVVLAYLIGHRFICIAVQMFD